MKFSTMISVITLLAPGGFASPTHVQRDIAAIEGVLSNINTQVNALNTAIKQTPPDPESIVAQSDTLIQTIQDGTVTVRAQPVLGQLDALNLVTPTQKLASDTQTTINSLISIKATILRLGYGCTTLESLQKQFDAATALSAAVVSKVPAGLEGIAKDLADSIANAIQSGITAYQGSCDSTSTTTTTTTAAPTSTTQPPTSTTTTTGPTACPAY